MVPEGGLEAGWLHCGPIEESREDRGLHRFRKVGRVLALKLEELDLVRIDGGVDTRRDLLLHSFPGCAAAMRFQYQSCGDWGGDGGGVHSDECDNQSGAIE